MTTRSSQLATATVTSTAGVVVYVCPEKTIGLLKRITYSAEPSGTSLLQVLAITTAGDYVLLRNDTISQTTVADVETWFVLEPTDAIQLTMTAGVGRFWLSGAELVDPLS